MQGQRILQRAVQDFRDIELLPKAIRTAGCDTDKDTLFSLLGPIYFDHTVELEASETAAGAVQEVISNKLLGEIISIEQSFVDFAYKNFREVKIRELSLEALAEILPGKVLADCNILLAPSVFNNLLQVQDMDTVCIPADKENSLFLGYLARLGERDLVATDRAINLLTDYTRRDTLRVLKDDTAIILPHELELTYKIEAENSTLSVSTSAVQMRAQIYADVAVHGDLAGCRIIKVEGSG